MQPVLILSLQKKLFKRVIKHSFVYCCYKSERIFILMMKQLFLGAAFFLGLQMAGGQTESKNIIINSIQETVRFEKGNKENPVWIKHRYEISYTCQEYRTVIPFAEFYNDKESIDNVDVYVNDKKSTKNVLIHKEPYNADGIFYSDEKILYLQLPLEKKGTTSTVILEKTITDPRYLGQFFFSNRYPVSSHQINIILPDWAKTQIKEFNLSPYAITRKEETQNGATTVQYYARDLPAFANENFSQGPTYTHPHIILITQEAIVNNEQIAFFKNTADQYAWYASLVRQIGNDDNIVREKALEITRDKISDLDKIKALYHWVQQNIRYLAFENGIAGFRPESAQEVIRKKYGDCKGMANLTKSLLSSLGYDAHLCWLGTNHIAYDYSFPSLLIDNHMICELNYNGKKYYLDATENNIGFDEYGERIQGRQVLVENGKDYTLEKIPVRDFRQNTETENKEISIEGTALVGDAVQSYAGESKEYLLGNIETTQKDKQENALRDYITNGQNDYQISDVKKLHFNPDDSTAVLQYHFAHRNAVAAFGNELYVDLDLKKIFADYKLDTAKRKTDFLFPFKVNKISTISLTIPAGYKLQNIPPLYSVTDPVFEIKAGYTRQSGKVIYQKEIRIKQTLLEKKHFQAWNQAIKGLNEFYNNQLTFIKS